MARGEGEEGWFGRFVGADYGEKAAEGELLWFFWGRDG